MTGADPVSRCGTTSRGTLFYTLLLLVGLPLAGVFTAGLPVSRYLEFPPLTRYVTPAPFSWPVFLSMCAVELIVVGPLLFRVLRAEIPERVRKLNGSLFPWWGWLGAGWLLLAWVLAWSRFDWVGPLQRHTFTPLWLGYIVVVNALTFMRTGRCLLRDRPRYLALLFVASAAFWWYFEFLNRFVQNWFYAGIGTFSAMEYFVFATMAFSTVIPAVMSTRELLASFPRLSAGLDNFIAVRPANPCRAASVALVVTAVVLANIGRWPDYLFPMLWLAPLAILVSLQVLRGEAHVFSDLAAGNWRPTWLAALAALICGLFWEMWNFASLAHWEYTVSLVQRFEVFEMPIVGFAGYLPFGIECLAVACLVAQKVR